MSLIMSALLLFSIGEFQQKHFNQTLKMLKKESYYHASDSDLYRAAINGMLDYLDLHSIDHEKLLKLFD